MKRILSVSIGSSTRDHRVETTIMGQDFILERKGTDGDIKKAIQLIKENDGKVDAFGMGGIDIYICGGDRRYVIKDALPLKRAAVKTPMVDGTGLKNTLERNVIRYINENNIINLEGKKVLVVSAMDRFGMAKAFEEAGAKVACGDLIFALGIPKQLNSIRALHRVARCIAPVVCRLPFKILYPTGKSQEISSNKFEVFYQNADIIAGDYLYIKKYLPHLLTGKVIITNTVTVQDVAHLASIGVETLITTTPEYDGRSFGTNVMDAIIVALAGKGNEDLMPEEYNHYLSLMDIKPRIEYLNKKTMIGGKVWMGKFGFIIHPLFVDDYARRYPLIKRIPKKLIKKWMGKLPPMKVSRTINIKSSQGTAEGYGVIIPLLPEQLLRLSVGFVQDRVLKACKLTENMGAQIAGLGAFTSMFEDKGLSIVERLSIPVTTGSSYAMATTLEAIRLAYLAKQRDLREAQIIIVGANGSMVDTWAKILAREAKFLTLVSEDVRQRDNLAEEIMQETGLAVHTTNQLKGPLKRADIVIIVSGSEDITILPGNLKKGAIVCDMSRLGNVVGPVAEMRKDVLIIKDVVIKVPGEVDFNLDFGLPPGMCYASTAETMVLAMEERFENYSIDSRLEPKKIDEIWELGKKHGFILAGIKSPEGFIPYSRLEKDIAKGWAKA